MPTNLGTLERAIRAFAIAPLAIAIAVLLGATSTGAIVLFVVAGLMLATSAVSFCPLYALVRGRHHSVGAAR